MRTFRTGDPGADPSAPPPAEGGDLTRWRHDPATGLCTNKAYADGSSVAYTFTPDSRPLRTVWARGQWKENAYDPATGDPAGVTYSDATPPVAYARDRSGNATAIADASGATAFTRRPDGTVLNARTFIRDALARLAKAQRVRPGTAPAVCADTFAHNARSELVHAASGTNAFGYLYDGIGGRELAAENAATNLYAANGLNQYTSISTSAPPCEFTPVFDADGNQTLLRTETGVWHVQYNAENRPVTFISGDGPMVGILVYDYVGRMAERVESQDGALISFERYIYRGYLRIAALDMLNNAAVVHTVVWDPTEPSATRPLLLTVPNPANSEILAEYYTFGFDQAKNVTELFDSSGNIAATYDHGPFGEDMASTTGPAAALNPFRFSSEVWDATLGLVQYTFRPYNPLDGRFTSRDPIGEDGGLNLYGFAGNDPITFWDYLGNAYFALRPLKNTPWVPGASHNPIDDYLNTEFAHEQLFFEDGKAPSNYGFFDDHDGTNRVDSSTLLGQYRKTKTGFNDCVMRIAITKVTPKPYSLLGIGSTKKYNCQDYMEDVRKKYYELLKDHDVKKKCCIK
jgi:RHS repeat-associated protein